MGKPKIAVIISTTRATRFGEKPAKWIYDIARARTAEYNRSMPAVLKNALDYAYPEWNRKAPISWPHCSRARISRSSASALMVARKSALK